MPIALPVENERGERLVAVRADPQGRRAAGARADVCLVIAETPEGVLLVRSRSRGVWELPGGFLDAGESPAACAARELREETGCDGRDFAVVAGLVIERPRQHATGPMRATLFRCTVASVPRFTPDAEISAFATFRVGAPPPGLSAIDAALLGRFAPHARPMAAGERKAR